MWRDSWLDKKRRPYICCLQETNLRIKDTHRLKEKGWKKIIHANKKEKKIGVAMLISDKIDFKTRDKETLRNVKGNNPEGEYNSSKTLMTQYGST